MTNMSKEKRTAIDWVESNRGFIIKVSDQIYDYAEPSLQEYKSAEYYKKLFKEMGFKIENVKGQPTAFIATWDNGKPVIATYGECEATEGNDQDQVPYRKPIPGKAGGFQDMHNGIGAGAMGALFAAKSSMEKHGLNGTLKFFLTPAEKLCIGKPFMARDGYFNELDACLGWHPFYKTMADITGEALAYQNEQYNFYGISAYGARPYIGKSALDAVTLMDVNVQYIREHVLPFETNFSINSIITNGGQSFTDIPAFAQAHYILRAPKREHVDKIIIKLEDCAKAACKVTGCTFDKYIVSGTWQSVHNRTLMSLINNNIQIIGPPKFTTADKTFMNKILINLGRKDEDEPWDLSIEPLGKDQRITYYADDHSELCYFCPMGLLHVTYMPKVDPYLPSWATASLAAMHVGHECVMTGAKILAASIIELLTSPKLLLEAKQEFEQAGLRKIWKSPLSPNQKPWTKSPIE